MSSEILVVEDSRTQAEHLKNLLQESGYTVRLAANGHEALIMMRQQPPTLVISDILMPGMNGYDLCHAIKQDKALMHIPVVLLTTLSDPEDIIRGLDCGAESFVVKPYDEPYLLTRLEQLLVASQKFREGGRIQMHVDIFFAGKRHVINTDRQQILDLLVSTFENAVQQNRQLLKTQHELTLLNEQLEDLVQERTQKLQASEANYRVLLEASIDGLLVVDQQNLVRFVNPAAEALLGYPTEALLGEPCPCSLGEGATREISLVRGNGETAVVEMHRVATQWEEEGATLVSLRDITARHRAEHERRQLEAQLRQAQKLEALGTLAGGIAHDFNNILGVIFGYIELALDEIPPTTRAWRHLEQVLSAGTRAKNLVQQILAFSRQGEQEPKPVQLVPLIKEVLEFLRVTLPTTIEIRHALHEETGTVLANPTQMHQILMNLCTNAAYAMRESGGVLSVGLDAYEVTATAAGHSGLTPGPYLRLTVRDTGHGISPEIRERIFEPFFTTKKVGEGTGMGLAVVHGIVTKCGGAVAVESAPGHGATFTVSLPCSNHTAPAPGDPEEAVPLGTERILFVDDESALAQLGHQLLSRLGYEVVSLSNSVEALEIFRAQPDRFDLVITDQTMPHMIGDVLTCEIRRLRPNIPIILCTGFSQMLTAEKVETLGIDALCVKPLVARDLARTIRQVLAQRTTKEN